MPPVEVRLGVIGRSRHLAAVLVSALLIGCAADRATAPPDLITELPRPLTAAEHAVRDGANSFGINLLQQIVGAQPDSNVFISPLSASMALGMTMNGAAGTTFDSMRLTLGFGDQSRSEINEGYRSLIDLLRGLDRSTVIRIANSIWADEGFPFYEEFLEDGRRYFDAEIASLDLGTSAAIDRINNWVSGSTEEKIPEVLDAPDPDIVMYLINAIYFDGRWRTRFDVAATTDAPFYNRDGGPATIKLMNRTGLMPYVSRPRYQAVDLVYGAGAYAMTVVLPAADVDVNDLAASMTAEEWLTLADEFADAEVVLSLPRISLSYERMLNDDLTALGMGVAFNRDRADFSRMSPERLFIDFVKQLTRVEVDEAGTVAAAATVVGMVRTSAPRVETVRVDRPFLFAIRERLSGTILFIGRVVRLPD